jgi:predicted O-methyltransferase YrrM
MKYTENKEEKSYQLSAWKGHADFAKWLVNRIQPTTTVDLGVDYGFSLFALAEPEIGTVYGIDTFTSGAHGNHPDNYDVVMGIKERYNFSNVEVIKGLFSDVVVNWTKPIDILHIDGDHQYESIVEDWNNWFPFLTENGVVIMHDTNSDWVGIKKFYDEITIPKCNFLQSYGLGVASRNKELIDEIKNVFGIE